MIGKTPAPVGLLSGMWPTTTISGSAHAPNGGIGSQLGVANAAGSATSVTGGM